MLHTPMHAYFLLLLKRNDFEQNIYETYVQLTQVY